MLPSSSYAGSPTQAQVCALSATCFCSTAAWPFRAGVTMIPVMVAPCCVMTHCYGVPGVKENHFSALLLPVFKIFTLSFFTSKQDRGVTGSFLFFLNHRVEVYRNVAFVKDYKWKIIEDKSWKQCWIESNLVEMHFLRESWIQSQATKKQKSWSLKFGIQTPWSSHHDLNDQCMGMLHVWAGALHSNITLNHTICSMFGCCSAMNMFKFTFPESLSPCYLEPAPAGQEAAAVPVRWHEMAKRCWNFSCF